MRQDCGGGELTVAIERVHASKRLLAAVACVGTQVEVQGLVPLAIVLAGETLLATGPLAPEWSLLVVRSEMTYQQTTLTRPFMAGCDASTRTFQVEMASERAPTARNRADERGLPFSAALTCLGGCGRCDLLPLNLCPWVHTRLRRGWQALGDEGRAA